LRDLAQLRLARAQQQLGRSDAALAALGEVHGEGYRSLVAELKGDIHLAQGEQTLAAQAYKAALAAKPEGQQRPILDMKLADLPVNP
jgi:predicted negative regulator of RcsB-dependent stress response